MYILFMYISIIIALVLIIGIPGTAFASTEENFGIDDISQYSNRQVDCEDNPDHPFCNGKRGQDGYIFCSLRDDLSNHMNLTCWDDDEYENGDPLIYCATDPETKEDCEIN
jgi:hypothetical protein